MLAISIEGKKHKIVADFGWFKDNSFMLFDFQLFSLYTRGSICLFQLQIAKFVVALFVIPA